MPGAGGGPARESLTVVGDQPVGTRRHPGDPGQEEEAGGEPPGRGGAAQHRRDRAMPGGDGTVGADPLQGVGRLLLADPERGEVGELPGDDLSVGPDPPLHEPDAGRAEGAVAVEEEDRSLRGGHAPRLDPAAVRADVLQRVPPLLQAFAQDAVRHFAGLGLRDGGVENIEASTREDFTGGVPSGDDQLAAVRLPDEEGDEELEGLPEAERPGWPKPSRSPTQEVKAWPGGVSKVKAERGRHRAVDLSGLGHLQLIRLGGGGCSLGAQFVGSKLSRIRSASAR